MALSLWSMTVIVAPICGPIWVWISDNFITRAGFFAVNVPLVMVVFFLSALACYGSQTAAQRNPVDLVDCHDFNGISALQLMLDRGEAWIGCLNEVIVLAMAAVVGISFLIVWELGAASDHRSVTIQAPEFAIGVGCTSAWLICSRFSAP